MGVDFTTQPVFRASTPRVILPVNVIGGLRGGLDGFDASPDGQRFLIHQQSSEAAQTAQILRPSPLRQPGRPRAIKWRSTENATLRDSRGAC